MTPDSPLDAAFTPGLARERSVTVRQRPAPPRRRTETEITLSAMNLINSIPGAHAQKVHTGAMGNKGEPDVDACVRGRAVKLEAKAMGKRPAVDQEAAMRRWSAAGALVGWFTCDDHVRQLLDHVDDADFVPDLKTPGCPCARHGASS